MRGGGFPGVGRVLSSCDVQADMGLPSLAHASQHRKQARRYGCVPLRVRFR